MPGNQLDRWQPYWEPLFAQLAGGVPPDWRVVVCADRGLYADWLFAATRAVGWHPFLRINQHPNKTIQVLPNGDWQLLKDWIRLGQAWSGAFAPIRSIVPWSHAGTKAILTRGSWSLTCRLTKPRACGTATACGLKMAIAISKVMAGMGSPHASPTQNAQSGWG
ncbi:hypothetical protein [Phormidesmis sp. 146-33]